MDDKYDPYGAEASIFAMTDQYGGGQSGWHRQEHEHTDFFSYSGMDGGFDASTIVPEGTSTAALDLLTGLDNQLGYAQGPPANNGGWSTPTLGETLASPGGGQYPSPENPQQQGGLWYVAGWPATPFQSSAGGRDHWHSQPGGFTLNTTSSQNPLPTPSTGNQAANEGHAPNRHRRGKRPATNAPISQSDGLQSSGPRKMTNYHRALQNAIGKPSSEGEMSDRGPDGNKWLEWSQCSAGLTDPMGTGPGVPDYFSNIPLLSTERHLGQVFAQSQSMEQPWGQMPDQRLYPPRSAAMPTHFGPGSFQMAHDLSQRQDRGRFSEADQSYAPPLAESTFGSQTQANLPFECGGRGCHMSFKTRSALSKHARCHQPLALRAHLCRECNKRFDLAKDLQRHYRTQRHRHRVDMSSAAGQSIVSAARFECGVCGKSFSRKDNCKRHEKKHGGVDNNP